jgi:transposase
LKAVLLKFYATEPELIIYCGPESTGGFENNWYNYLHSLTEELNLRVVRLNPVVISGINKASLNRTVTDETSALNIATYLISYKGKIDYQKDQCENTFQDSRSVHVCIKLHIKQETQLRNHLNMLIYRSTPELVSVCKRGIPQWLLRLLSKYPISHDIKRAGINKLVKIKGISETRAKSIMDTTFVNQNTISLDLAFAIKQTSEEILYKMGKVEELQSFLSKKYVNHPIINLLTSIRGIGLNSAIHIMFEIEDINRFQNAKKLVAFFGINPEYRQSGDGTCGNHMSKKGRKSLRSVLYMCSLSASNCDPEISKLYQRYRSAGKCHDFDLGVIMHKLLRIIYGVLKSGKPYDITIDLMNRDRSLEKQQCVEEQKRRSIINNRAKKRRYLKTENPLSAPISGRKARKLKELATSLSTESAMVQDHHQPVQK